MPTVRRFGIPAVIALAAAFAPSACDGCGNGGGNGEDAGAADGAAPDSEAGADVAASDGSSGQDAAADAEAGPVVDATSADAPADAPADSPIVDAGGCGTECGIQIDAHIDICPQIQSWMISPVTAAVFQQVTLDVTAVDVSGNPITYLWSATAGSIADSTSASTTYTCTSAGNPTITIAISDGVCGDQRSVAITCTK